jgi:NADH-quinone oxidoreductase subunit A
MNPYVPVLIILIIGLTLGVVLSTLSRFLGPKRPNPIKNETYECGVPQVQEQSRMSVKFYMTAILFILFDIEAIFLFLWARVFRDLGWFGFVEVMVFMAILISGYVYVLKRGALEWD